MATNEPKQTDPSQKKTCPSCGGSGHLGLFHGESRFMISWEECYDCSGTGYLDAEQSDNEADENTPSD